jgi:hypothetical protein
MTAKTRPVPSSGTRPEPSGPQTAPTDLVAGVATGRGLSGHARCAVAAPPSCTDALSLACRAARLPRCAASHPRRWMAALVRARVAVHLLVWADAHLLIWKVDA